jgi:WD40 repeat protein
MRILSAHSSPIGSIAFSPDGALLAEGVKNGRVRVWNVARGEVVFEENHWGCECSVRPEFSPCGRFLDVASAWVTRVAIADYSHEKIDYDLMKYGAIEHIVYSPDGRELLQMGYREFGRYAADRQPLPPYRIPGEWQRRGEYPPESKRAAFSPDSTQVAIAYNRPADKRYSILIFDRESRKIHRTLTWDKHEAKRLAFHPSRPLLAAACGPVLRVWNLDSSELLAEIKVGKLHHFGAAFSPCGRHLAAVSKDRTVRFWDAATFAESRVLDWEIDKLLDLAFSPDGTVCAVASDSGKILLFDVE